MAWLASIADRKIQKGHLPKGHEITKQGVSYLPFSKDAMTCFTMIQAEDLDEVESIVGHCPIVLSTRVYEVISH